MQGSARAGVRGRGAVVGICFLALAGPVLVALPQERDQTRSWKDASGKFEVRAKLVERTPKEVKLLTDKGREVTVPIDRLSKADHDYLDGLAAPADNPFAGGRPATGKPSAAGKPRAAETPGEKPGFVAAGTKMSAKTVLPGMGTTLSLKAPAGDMPFVADPRPPRPELPATAVSLGKAGSPARLWGPFVTAAAVSGTGRQMAIAQRSGVVVVETATGKVLRAVATGGFKRASVAFDDSGTRLAMCTGNQFLVKDLVKNEAAHEAITTAELGRMPIRWVGPDMFLTGHGALVHAGLETAVWHYSCGSGARTASIGDKQLVLCKERDEAIVTALDVPDGPVEAVIAALEKLGDEDMVMLPGSPIRVMVEAPDKGDQALIAEWVGRSLNRTGWKVTDDAPVTLVACIGQEPKREISMRDMTAGGKDGAVDARAVLRRAGDPPGERGALAADAA